MWNLFAFFPSCLLHFLRWAKIVILVLSALLIFSLTALAGVLICRRQSGSSDMTASAPDNLITPESARPLSAPTPSAREETVLRLYRGQPEDNTAFACGNLLPGDVETKYFRVQVSHKSNITVSYHADIRPCYEKLAEVLKVRIVLLTTGHTLYDGLMRDMPKQLSSPLSGSGTDELHYEITAYLDTSVGNDYQNKDLIADFRWWVEETGNLGPETGDSSGILLWIAAAAVSGAVCIFLIISHKRKEGKQND